MYEAMQVANILSEREGLDSCYECTYSQANSLTSLESCAEKPEYELKLAFHCPGYRLPTNSEWTMAARSGTTDYFWTLNGGGDNKKYVSDFQIIFFPGKKSDDRK